DVAAMSLPSIGGKFDPKMLATDVPFLYTGREHVWKVHEGPVGKELMNRFEPLGAKPFCYGGGWGFRGVLSNKRSVQAPADLKKVIDETMQVACAQHRQDEVKAEADGLLQMKAKGMQVNDIKDLRPFQERAQPVWKFVEGKVGKELFDRVIAEAKAAAK